MERRVLAWAASFVVAWVAQASAQGSYPARPDQTIIYAPSPLAGSPTPVLPTDASDSPKGWFAVDYLFWWTKSAPTPPLVTSGGLDGANPGGDLGGPNTSILYGGNSLGFGVSSGIRVGFGAWFDEDHTLGFEAGGFLLEQRADGFRAASDAAALPILGQPTFQIGSQTVLGNNGLVQQPLDARESVYFTSLPGAFSGSIASRYDTRLFGWDVNALAGVSQSGPFQVELLGGFRHLNLRERLTIASRLDVLEVGGLSFNGDPMLPGQVGTSSDSFRCTSDFYGGQIGARVRWQGEALGLSLLGKVALGNSRQVTDIEGTSARFAADGTLISVAPGGILAQNTNIGRHSRNRFAVAPEVGLNATYDVASWLQVTFGYTFLYVSSVARPGEQIDRVISVNQVPTDQRYNSAVPVTNPLPRNASSDYWAQGLNLGLGLKW